MKTVAALVSIALLATLAVARMRQSANQSLVVHEWGTFTTLQDETGESIGGINTDDEPVPGFVHRLASWFFIPRDGSVSPYSTFKVVASGPNPGRCHLDVKMRLETPVLYFYPPSGGTVPPFDVHVMFRGGWLTEFYPDAAAHAPSFDAAHPDRLFAHNDSYISRSVFERGFGHLRPETEGDLQWKGVQLVADGSGPDTQAKVWLAPRAVPASMLQTAEGEREKFLFYRGVGNAASALRVVRDESQHTLEIRDAATNSSAASAKIAAAWLVEVLADGRCAFRSLGALPSGRQPRATVPAQFFPADFSDLNLVQLQTEMRGALIRAGLFPPEADALLRTWEVSYFKSPGQRLFYLCPAAEVEALLPLKVSVPCALTRVMLGRVELVTPEQRRILAGIASGLSTLQATKDLAKPKTGQVGDLQFTHPENVFLPLESQPHPDEALGRFRNALLLDEEKRRPTELLHAYIHEHGFEPYRVQ